MDVFGGFAWERAGRTETGKGASGSDENGETRNSFDCVGYTCTVELQSPSPADDVSTLTVVQLKERLRAAGLPVSGAKSVLIERLQTME
mmetsp:Transcript_54358/g.63528  ORF Transcript_54358/g.63528 Transcript_54358/m.63528 type:complete len:89 (-) Transcript_54358:101-367(-)